MIYSKLTFGDIMQSKILFYDEEVREACMDICSTLHIDNMPALNGESYFELVNGNFQNKIIQGQNKQNVDDKIFDNNLIEKFRFNKHNVLFVFEGEVLKGLVHICDYNLDIVIQSIQDDVLIFERNLRQWLILNGFDNKDIINYFKYKSEKHPSSDRDREFWKLKYQNTLKRIDEMYAFSKFQLFEFSDLLHFLNSTHSEACFRMPKAMIDGKEQNGITVLTTLRNLAMHGKNPVTFDQPGEIYSLRSLQILFDQLEFLKIQTHRLMLLIRNHPDYLKSIKMDNKNKLRIIHDYHPRALWYFIGRQ